MEFTAKAANFKEQGSCECTEGAEFFPCACEEK